MTAALTRQSLLVRLKDRSDAEAWSQFAEIYSPLVFRFARRCGLQESDSADLVQEVMGEVAKSMTSFQYDPQLGKFRSWLYKIAKRTMARLRQKQQRQPQGTGDTQVVQMLENKPDPHDEIERYWDHEYQQQLMQWAADQIKASYLPETWQAFWRTAVKGETPQSVATELGMSVGAVYVAKSRVTKRLSETIRAIDDNQA